MELAARAETWLRICAGKLLGPPAPVADEVDPHGVYVLSSVAQALGVLEVLDAPTIDAVFTDLGIAAGVRGRRVTPNELRGPEGFAWQMPMTQPAGAPASGTSSPAPPAVEPWPPETFDAGAVLHVEGAIVHVLWVTRTPAGAFAPVRVLFPTPGATSGANVRPPPLLATMAVSVPFGPGVPGVEVLDGAGGRHDLAWPLAQGDGTRSWGTASLSPDLPRVPETLAYRVTGGVGDGEKVAFAAPAPSPVGTIEDLDGTPAERYLARYEGRAPVETSRALRELGLVREGFVLPERAAEPGVPALASVRLRPPSLAVPAASRAVGAMLPLRRPVYVEGLTVEEGRLVVHVRMQKASPALWWEAVDPSGRVRPARLTGGWHGAGTTAAGVEVALGSDEQLQTLRLVAATPFESAWVDLALPEAPAYGEPPA
jgi:hypothetical protein